MATISFQLYSARDIDLKSNLAMLSDLGIREVEGFAPQLENPAETCALLESYGLSMPTAHFAIDLIESEPQRCIEVAKSIGIQGVVVPYIEPNQRPDGGAAWQAMAERVAAMGKPIVNAGLRFAWHNHEFEFQPLSDGKLPIEYLTEAMPELELELDLAWIYVAGQNPVVCIERYANRIIAVHIKDKAAIGENHDEGGWADVGFGVLDWDAIVTALKAANVQRYVIEHDQPNDVERFARRSFQTVSGF